MNKNDAKSNFGKWGWWIIIYSAICFYLYGGVTNSSLNTVIPMQSAQYGWDKATLLALATPAAIVALVVCLLLGKVVYKKGVVFTNTIVLFCAGLSVIWWGQASTLKMYVVAFFVMVTLLNSVMMIGGNMIISNWFPRKKGLAIGWSTMGLNVSSATVVIILVGLAERFGGISGALTVFGIALIVMAVITKLFVKDFPEMVGLYPDNDPNSERIQGKAITGWTTVKLLKSKEIWLISIANGFYGMVTIGFVSQMVPTLLQRGIVQPRAIALMSIASLIGVVGSYVCGYIDQKYGVKKSSVFYGIWVIVAILFYLAPNSLICLYIFVGMLGFSLGGSSNYPVSMTAQIYGRKAFANAFPIVNFVNGLFRSFCFIILAISLKITGSFFGGYIAYAVLILIAVIIFAYMDFTQKEEPPIQAGFSSSPQMESKTV